MAPILVVDDEAAVRAAIRLRQVKSDERTKVIPVVILTSSRQEPDIKTYYELGANSYIVKPVDFDKLVEAVSGIGLYWMLLNEPPRSRQT